MGVPYKLLGEVIVTGAAASSIDFAGLNIGKNDLLLLVSDVYNPTASAPTIYLYVNGNNTNANYYCEYDHAYGTSLTVGRLNYPSFMGVSAGGYTVSMATLKLTEGGYFVYQEEENEKYGGALPEIETICGGSTFTMSAINSLQIVSSVSGAFGIGSRFRLYKLNAKKLADISVAAACTSVDITGLNLDKTGEYLLISDITNTVGSSHFLYVNGNVTASNYYTQSYYADGTGAAGARTNDPYICGANATKTLSVCLIRLSNNGNFIFQSHEANRPHTANIYLEESYGASLFTMASITQLTITASAANGIGAGSRFQLYKLK